MKNPKGRPLRTATGLERRPGGFPPVGRQDLLGVVCALKSSVGLLEAAPNRLGIPESRNPEGMDVLSLGHSPVPWEAASGGVNGLSGEV